MSKVAKPLKYRPKVFQEVLNAGVLFQSCCLFTVIIADYALKTLRFLKKAFEFLVFDKENLHFELFFAFYIVKLRLEDPKSEDRSNSLV